MEKFKIIIIINILILKPIKDNKYIINKNLYFLSL